jgi:hypothetical protein
LRAQAAVEAQLSSVLEQYKMPTEQFTHWRVCSHERATQHNLRVCAAYYKRIRMPRLAHLLGLSADEAEQALAALVSEGQVRDRYTRTHIAM